MADNRCVCCGEIIPEGRQVCWVCENGCIRGHRGEMKFYEDSCSINKAELEEVLKPFMNIHKNTV